MLTKDQLEKIFDALSIKYSRYLGSEEGRTVFEDFKSAIQQMNQPIEKADEKADKLIASGHAIMTNFLKDLEQTNKSSQSVTTQGIETALPEFKGKLNVFKVTLQNSLVQYSTAIFLSEAKKEAMYLGIDKEAISKLITFTAAPKVFNQFKKIIDNLKQSFDKDPLLKTAIESALRACNPEVALGDFKRQENLRALINSTVQNNESLLYILQNLNIVRTQRFADIKTKELSLSSFKKEVLLEAYRTSLAFQRESPFDSEGHISKFTQHFLDHFVPATTYAEAVTLEKTISLKQEEALPEAINIKKSHGNPNYELTRINVTPVDADNPKHWLCYHLGDAVNCCLHAGGGSERCITDGLTKSTSGFYVITEKKGRGNAKEKICAAIYAFMSRKGNLVLDSIEPLNTRGKSEYAALVHDLVMEFAASVVQDTQREHPIQRVCLGIDGNTELCFDRETLTHKALPFRHEQTQEGTLQYRDSNKVIVLAHSPAEEERLQVLMNALVGTREESETEDTQGLRTIVRELILFHCSELFYVQELDDIEHYINLLQAKGLQQSFQRDEASEIQGLLTLESFYKEAFTLMLPWVCQDKHIGSLNFFLKRGVDIDTTYAHEGTALCIACDHGQTAIIKLLLAKGADVNRTDRCFTPLTLAAAQGHIAIVASLLAIPGIQVNLSNMLGDTPLSLAVSKGNVEAVKILLAAGADVNCKDHDGDTPLFLAVENGYVDIAKVLVETGADVNIVEYGSTVLFRAIQKGYKEIEELLLKANAKMSLGEAVRLGRAEIVKELLETHANLNFADANTDEAKLLLIAVKNGYTETVKALITAGANVNIVDKDRSTVLFTAIQKGYKEIEELLLKANAKMSLGEAVSLGRAEIVKELLETNANLNLADANTDEAKLLLMVVKDGRKDYKKIVKALIAAGANVNLADNNGETPLYIATLNCDTDILKMLLEAGADVNLANNDGETPLFALQPVECTVNSV